MRAWRSPVVPELPDGVVGPTVRVHCSSTDDLVELVPDDPARLYVCGITPYDATHMGHAATYVAFDLLNRAWRSAGHPVRYVQNVTDVDDPLLERARATGQDWVELAERETQLFRDDMEALAVLAPDEYIGAVEAIPLVVDMIDAMLRTRSGKSIAMYCTMPPPSDAPAMCALSIPSASSRPIPSAAMSLTVYCVPAGNHVDLPVSRLS